MKTNNSNHNNNPAANDEATAATAPSVLHFIGTSACLTGLMLLGLLVIKGKKLTSRILRRFLFWDSDQSTATMLLSLPGHGEITIPEDCLFIYPNFTASELAKQALQDRSSIWLGQKLSNLSDRDTLNGAGGKPILGFALGAAVLPATDRLLHKALVNSRNLEVIDQAADDGVRTLLASPTNHWIVAAGYGGMGSPNAILEATRSDEIARKQIHIPVRRHLVALAPSVCAGATLNYDTAVANFGGWLRQVCFTIERPGEVVLPVPGKPIHLAPEAELFHSVTIFGASNKEVCADGREAVAAMAARFLYLMTETPLSNRVAGDFRDSEHLFSERAQGSPRFFDRAGVSWHSTDPAGRTRAARLLGIREALSTLVQ